MLPTNLQTQWLTGVTLLLVFAITAPARALTIIINPGTELAANTAALDAFNRAADLWESLFTDAITVTIDANVLDLGSPNILGQTSSNLLVGSYNEVTNLLIADAADEIDDAIVAALPTSTQFSAFIPVGFTLDSNILLTKPNLKAIDNANAAAYDAMFGLTDATIEFNSGFSFDYDNSDGVDINLFDFETIAAHEIGHALGFLSSVDSTDFAIANNETGAINMTTLDLFRFGPAQNPTTFNDFTTFARDLVPGSAGYFDDLANEVLFSTGVYNGDGRQASHWLDASLGGTLLGIMNPTIAPGTVFSISQADIRALDVIGWDIITVPLPGTLLLYGTGLAGLIYRRRPHRQCVL